ncbi:MAG: Flp pilus assembly protein CpaB [Alphaproteobacteria bacterium]
MESKGRLILIAVAGVIVAFGAISVYKRMSSSDQAALVEKEISNRVLVANNDLVAGDFLDISRDVSWQDPKTEEGLTTLHIRETNTSLNSLSGAVIRRNLRGGEMLTTDMVMKSGEGGFMSAVLEPGRRAVSVSVNATSGNAGFISPGDRVDLIVTRKLRTNGSGNDEEVISQTFVEDIRVLAVDQSLDNPENKAILAKTVTLEVTPEEAERVAIATELGQISLALRSIVPVKKDDAPESEEKDLMKLYDGSPKMEESRSVSRIRVIRGDQVENLEMQ